MPRSVASNRDRFPNKRPPRHIDDHDPMLLAPREALRFSGLEPREAGEQTGTDRVERGLERKSPPAGVASAEGLPWTRTGRRADPGTKIFW